MLAGILDRFSPGGFLVLGKHETLPNGSSGLAQLGKLPIYQPPHDANPDASRPSENIHPRRS
jgi:hypothetical protein